MHETTLRGIGTVVTLVSGRQRMGPIKEMNFHTHVGTCTCSLNHAATQTRHWGQQTHKCTANRATAKEFCHVSGNQPEKKKMFCYCVESPLFFSTRTCLLTCLSSWIYVDALHNDSNKVTQSQSMSVSWLSFPLFCNSFLTTFFFFFYIFYLFNSFC